MLSGVLFKHFIGEVFKHFIGEIMENKVGLILNTPLNIIQKRLKIKNYSIKLIKSTKSNIPRSKKIIPVFDSLETLVKRIEDLKHSPIITESIVSAQKLNYMYEIIYLDAIVNSKGLITFKELEIKKLVSLSKKLFVGEQLEVVNLRGNTILTDTSSISRTVGVFLCTLPYITYKSFLIALATSAEEKNLSILSKMVKENRLVTNKNIKEYKKLVTTLEVAIKDFKTNKKTVETSRLIKLVARFGTEEIENYLDEEHNILS